MMIKDVLAKVIKGEALTDDEKKLVGEYDPDKATNDAAAASRRKAEADAKKLADKVAELEAEKARLEEESSKVTDAGKTEAEKLAKQIETLTRQVADIAKAKAESDAKATKLARDQSIGQIRAKNGLKFVDGVDPELVESAFARVFDGLESFDDDTEVKTRIDRFKTANKALILDTTGHGSGSKADPKGSVGLNGKPLDQMSAAEREQDLKQRGVI